MNDSELNFCDTMKTGAFIMAFSFTISWTIYSLPFILYNYFE